MIQVEEAAIKKGKNLNDSYPFNNSSYYVRNNLRTSMSSATKTSLHHYHFVCLRNLQ
jgi:hypothetical protein